MSQKGHGVFWLASEKDISRYLLNHYQIDYKKLERPGNGIFSKLKVMIINTFICIRFIKKHRINMILSMVSPYLSVAGFILRKPHIAIADTESAGIYDKLSSQFVSVLLAPKSYRRTLRKSQIRFEGNLELFYLHPKRFKPLVKTEVAELLGLDEEEPYVIIRFVSWEAFHDKGLSGFSDDKKREAVESFSKYSKVFISAEKPLPDNLQQYLIRVPPEKMHDVLAYARLFFGESATMASESAVLGIPAIYLNEHWLGYTDEEKEYGLLFSYKENLKDQRKAIEKGLEILKNDKHRQDISDNRVRFLKKKIDVTGFLLWFVEEWPESLLIMKKNPDYQYRFT
ncbi:MAG: hypothetical protein JW737_03285 [Acidobacteria bacterium]|nr:hypothetical protein [Acidobacteriota bacterium]